MLAQFVLSASLDRYCDNVTLADCLPFSLIHILRLITPLVFIGQMQRYSMRSVVSIVFCVSFIVRGQDSYRARRRLQSLDDNRAEL